MGLRLFFLPNFPGATFIAGAMFNPDSLCNPDSIVTVSSALLYHMTKAVMYLIPYKALIFSAAK